MYQFPENLKAAYEASPLSLVYYEIADGAPVPVLVSDGFCRYTGVSRAQSGEFLSKTANERIHPDDRDRAAKTLDDFLHKRGPCDIIFRCKKTVADVPEIAQEPEEKQYVQLHGFGEWQTMPDGTELAVVVCSDLSSSWQLLREQMQMFSLLQSDNFYKDPLTGLPNINYLHKFGDERVDRIRAAGQNPHMIYADVFALQVYNNQYGYAEGDLLLCLIARTLKELFPKALVVRGADDCFVLITWVDDAVEIERRLNEANVTIRANANGNTAGIRSGIYPLEEGISLMRSLGRAKRAMKLIANDMNRNVAMYSKTANDYYLHEHYIIEHFAQALQNGWIKVYYHALYRVKNRKIAAFEALSRWVDPCGDNYSPQAFIPSLLKYHQLYKLDLYVFEQVCRELKSWSEHGLPAMPLSVNFSRQDFTHIDVVEEMNRIYDEYDIGRFAQKSNFIVEITEQDLAADADTFSQQLRKIREAGYQLWLDDFGSEYSAINMLSRFRFDLIKCDMELLRHLDDNEGVNRFILKELVYLARQLGMPTLIEGLESEEQLRFVEEIGCELAQGFYYHRPETYEEILNRIQNERFIDLCETAAERAAL